MPSKMPWLMRGAKPLLVMPAVLVALAGPASAHVKWFAPYNVSAQPERLADVLSPLFVELFMLAVFVLWCVTTFEATTVGAQVTRAVNSVFASLRLKSDAFIRAGAAMFFVAIWVAGGIILTPELKTSLTATSWLQAGIAIGLFWQPTMLLSGLGIVALFVQGIWSYGLFHMMDYPIFLGTAGYFIIRGLGRETLLGLRPCDIIRWGVAITLMWASVEKWAYPDWTYPLLHMHPAITGGLDPRFFMVAAGVVEFSLAFALIWTPLVRRMAAIVLLAMFVSAVFEFGKLDAIGHLLIIVLLLVVAADDTAPHGLKAKFAPVCLSAALGATILAYYISHAVLYNTTVV